MLVYKYKKLFSGVAVATMLCLFTACGNERGSDPISVNNTDNSSQNDSVASDDQNDESTSESDTDTNQAQKTGGSDPMSVTEMGSDPIFDDTEAAIREFITGEWKLLNRDTNEDYASMVFAEDGSCTYTRLEDNASCTGKIYFEKSTEKGGNPDGFRLELNGIGDFIDVQETNSALTNSETSGNYHIGIGEGRDYLYLAEIGNGDTEISLSVFNMYDREDYIHWTNEWIFYRDNDVKSELAPVADENFYAFSWGRGDDGSVLLQKMKPYEFESYEEYTDRAYLAAYFGETEDLGVRKYELGAGADTSTFLHEDEFKKGTLYVYSVTTDSEGVISTITELDQSYYGMYDMGNLDPVFSYDDQTFYYNNSSFALKDFAPGTNAITDCERVGDFIILQCHANPHYSDNIFFSIYSGDFVFDILGANLTYKDDDLSTAVYSVYNQIYDIWGNLIGSVQEGEVFGLTFTGDDTIGAECWAIIDGEEKTFTEEFEFESVDHSMFTYYRYLLTFNSCSHWSEFVKEAPADASALLMVNAPNMIYDRITRPYIYEQGALDIIALVPLHNNQKAFFESTEPDASGNVTDKSDDYDLEKGLTIQFTVTVPEGMPVKNLVIRNTEGKELIWPIAQISGRVPQRSMFLAY